MSGRWCFEYGLATLFAVLMAMVLDEILVVVGLALRVF